jgi:hypothetical protein
MSAENQPSGILFNTKAALNLVEESLQGNVLSLRDTPIIQEAIAAGRMVGWINQRDRVKALQTLLLAEDIYFPHDITYSLQRPLTEAGIIKNPTQGVNDYYFGRIGDLGGGYSNDMEAVEDRLLNPKNVEFFKPFVIQGLASRGTAISSQEFDEIATYYSSMSRAWKEDWLRIYQGSWQLFGEVKKELSFLVDSYYLNDGGGVKTVTSLPTVDSFSSAKGLGPEDSGAVDEVVGMYFRTYIYTPRPLDIKEALRMKESPNIVEWRNRIFTLSARLASSAVNEVEIRKEIDEINRYFKGAKTINIIFSPLVQLIFTGADFATSVIPPLQPLHAIAIGANLLVTYFGIHGWLAERAVLKAPDEKYRWAHIDDSG